MSNPLRPPLVGPPPTMPGTMMAPVCTTGIPGAPVIPVVPSAYGLIGPQPTTYMQHPGFPQQKRNLPIFHFLKKILGKYARPWGLTPLARKLADSSSTDESTLYQQALQG
ncbi:hypothetical protein AVEN_42259-1 [Araneus ventricosus]|uniref:Uncharacterized protein n=1 Tax=Araneus ventricosus TaxID=182803 RepID=A0A4Y2H2G3_ARAVE|nr:hypothetical protein AVEN_42259-1 [Araneus ventricosus]